MSAHVHDHPFKFYRIRGGQETRIYPHAGARLHFGSREADSLTLPTLPVGTLAAGDQVKVTYTAGRDGAPRTVFLGTVDKRSRRYSGGSEQTENVTVLGPWAKMARLVYLQDGTYATPSGQSFVIGTDYSSRLILNETKNGIHQTLNDALLEIANGAKAVCGYQVSSTDISVSTQILPSDECRDITVADAIRRELRLFPKAVARFEYSTTPPTLVIDKGSAADYSVPDKTEREIEFDENPITGVDLEIEATGEIDGASYRQITHQKAGTAAGNPGCLYATLQIKGASSNTVRQSFKSVTEDPSGSWKSADWWKQKHPRLANVATSALTLSEVKCDGSASLPTNYPRISAATAGELEEAGLKCKVFKFTAKATIETTDDKEEEVYLTMHFLMTNAKGTADDPKTYTWVSESSAESGETVPAGLAATILAERCGSIRSERMTIRLGETFPAIGDTITDDNQTLPLQSFDVDCADLTAELNFGAPEYLSPEDMSALLSNFRNKRTTTSSTIRKTGKESDKGASNVEMGGIPPLSSTEFKPGTKSKTTIKASSGSGGSIELDSSKLEGGEKVEVHDLTIKGEKEEDDKIFKVLSNKDVKIPAVGVTSLNGLTGALTIIGGYEIEVNFVSENVIMISYKKGKKPDSVPTTPADPCDHPGDKPGTGGQGGVPAEDDNPSAGGGSAVGGGIGGGVPADGDTHAGEPCPDCSPTR